MTWQLDATALSALREKSPATWSAGAVIVGKITTPELATYLA
jgi:hypothetical protein